MLNTCNNRELTTTIDRLNSLDRNACGTSRLPNSVMSTLKDAYPPEASINLLEILALGGVESCVWAMRATEQNCQSTARLMAVEFAELVLLPEDEQARKVLQVARTYAQRTISADLAQEKEWFDRMVDARDMETGYKPGSDTNNAILGTLADNGWEAAFVAMALTFRQSTAKQQAEIIRTLMF